MRVIDFYSFPDETARAYILDYLHRLLKHKHTETQTSKLVRHYTLKLKNSSYELSPLQIIIMYCAGSDAAKTRKHTHLYTNMCF